MKFSISGEVFYRGIEVLEDKYRRYGEIRLILLACFADSKQKSPFFATTLMAPEKLSRKIRLIGITPSPHFARNASRKICQ